MKNEDVLCVKNYDAGASISESYTNFQSLDKDTIVVSRSGENNSSNAFLQVSINSLVVGNAHLGWQSVNPYRDMKGRHAVLSRNEENLNGAFSIEKFIQLSFNGILGGTSEWLPCSQIIVTEDLLMNLFDSRFFEALLKGTWLQI